MCKQLYRLPNESLVFARISALSKELAVHTSWALQVMWFDLPMERSKKTLSILLTVSQWSKCICRLCLSPTLHSEWDTVSTRAWAYNHCEIIQLFVASAPWNISTSFQPLRMKQTIVQLVRQLLTYKEAPTFPQRPDTKPLAFLLESSWPQKSRLVSF